MIKITKHKNINEIMITGNQTNNMIYILNNLIEPNIDNFLYDGDIESFKVMKSEDINLPGFFVIVSSDNEIAAFYQILEENNFSSLNLCFVLENYRGNKLSEMFIVYAKRHLGISKILLGNHFSNDMIILAQSLSKRFKIEWFNNDTVEPFNPENPKEHMDLMSPTGWRLLLENKTSSYKYPRFYGENGDFSGSFYSSLFN